MNKQELLKIIDSLPEECNVNIDITPVQKEEQPKEKKILKWKDIDSYGIEGYWIGPESQILSLSRKKEPQGRSSFATEAQAKSALAMAQLSQVIPYYCEPITNKEWNNEEEKWVIKRQNDELLIIDHIGAYRFLAFRTKEQAETFLQNNEELIKQYYMLD